MHRQWNPQRIFRRAVAGLPVVLLAALALSAAHPPGAGTVPHGQAEKNPDSKEKFKPDPKKAKAAYEQGLAAERDQNWAGGYEAYSQAVQWEPKNQEYLMHREMVKGRLIQA